MSDDTSTAALIRLAGRRPEPARFRAARVRVVVEAEWRRAVRSRYRRRAGWLLVAASAAALAMAVWLGTRPPEPKSSPEIAPSIVATVVRVVGPVHVNLRGSPSHPIAAGHTLTAGALVDTNSGGRTAFRMMNGASLRIDAGARVVFEGGSRIVLEQGRLYVDRVRAAQDVDALEISTKWGIVRDIGTQFEVVAAGGGVAVRVREGMVQIDGPMGSARAGRAESLRIDAGGLTRGSVATYGRDWLWAESLAAPFAIEGATLETFLHWAARERGLAWRFKDAATARQAATVVLHGSIVGFTPSEALDAVLPTSGMSHHVRGGQLVIALDPPAGTRR